MPKSKAPKRKKIKPIDENSPVFGKNFVISGSTSVLPQKKAEGAVKAMGGFCDESKIADFIVMGNMEYEMMKAMNTADEELRISSSGPVIISETDFLKMLNSK